MYISIKWAFNDTGLEALRLHIANEMRYFQLFSFSDSEEALSCFKNNVSSVK